MCFWDTPGYVSKAICQVLVPLGAIRNDTLHLKANPLFLVFQASSEANLLSPLHPQQFAEAGGTMLV